MDKEMNHNNNVNEITGLRNHFTYIFEEAWKTIVALIVIVLFNDGTAEILKELQNENWVAVAIGGAIIAVIFLIIILFFVNRWRKTYISVKDGMLTIERKLLVHYRNEIALVNISNINLEQNIFEMLVGTYKLKLDTNSVSTADKTDVKIILKADVAFMLKNTIMEMMKEEHESSEGQKEGIDNNTRKDIMDDISERDYDIIYNNKEIVKNCIAKTSILVLVIIVGLFISFGIQVSDLLKEGGSIGSAIITLLATLFLNFSVLSALVKSWFNDFRFRVKRDKDKIYVSSGLLKKKKYAIPINMINSVRIYTTFLGRIMRLYGVEIISVGGEDEDSQGKTVLLAGKMNDLREKLALILPEYEFPEIKKVERMPIKVLWIRLLNGVIFFGFMAVGIFIGFNIGCNMAGESFSNPDIYDIIWTISWALGISFVLYCVFGSFTYFQRGLYMGDNDIVVTEGCFGKRIMTIPYSKIQYINYSQGILQRMIKVNKGTVYILATMAFSSNSLGMYREETFEKLNEKFKETY